MIEEWREGERYGRIDGGMHGGRGNGRTEVVVVVGFPPSIHPSICSRAYVNQRSQITTPKRRISIGAQHNAAPPRSLSMEIADHQRGTVCWSVGGRAGR